ncbi:o-succinylbenzoate--CoA ligase [Geobacillus sp. 46C-IIa]|uniref:o-succinylbenzoate--CoA ligase n=1 Tax=Geobacillus sp. 46C-IIa TaxID=1963025 RepID=UPI0009BFCDEF|nr:o-succinylbenzoate--CoA ligase [Geobacillus sp. 46C-IIa]OQP06194.1 o-succinylbenzoate--CoA ligase [Geobacillus sp. 46C-IIa]QNU29289.1 o-succinylbenzoate--CoA ligase [Geobacillus sp. 46C-IIa]
MNMGIGRWLAKYSDRFPEKIALIYKDKRFSYSELNQRINRLSQAFLHLGVRKGDRVLSLLFNTNELLETMFACAKIGAIFVPINTRLSIDEVEYIVRDASGRVFVYDVRLEGVAKEIRKRVDHIQHYICVGQSNQEMTLLYETLLSSFPAEELSFEIKLGDVHMIMYTSGTTGKPKGAMLTHGNTQWNAINCINFLSIEERDITYTVAPMFHIGGMNIFTTPTLYKGGTVVLDDKFDPKITLETIEKEKITTLFLVPAMWLAIMQYPNFEDYNIRSLRLSVCGGAPCPLTVIEFFQKKGVLFYEGFGLTETSPFVSVLDDRNSIRKSGSVGKTPIHTEIRIVDSMDQDVPIGEVGELLVKGPNVFAGYWNNSEATQEAIKNGWFYTGDLAKMDEEGFLYIVDRKKDMIISGGENIYPVEVEQVIFRMPNVKEVAVVGVADEKWGESVKAYIVLSDATKTMTLEDVQRFCDGKLARYKIPKHIEIIDQLPRNATGKVLKNVLRQWKKEKGKV